MAERYSKLPSEIIKDATTFDYVIMDVAYSFREYRNRKQNGEPPVVDQATLLNILEKGKSNEN